MRRAGISLTRGFAVVGSARNRRDVRFLRTTGIHQRLGSISSGQSKTTDWIAKVPLRFFISPTVKAGSPRD